jgi:hypothetical protein
MKLQTKKLLARELIIIIVSILFIGCCSLTLWLIKKNTESNRNELSKIKDQLEYQRNQMKISDFVTLKGKNGKEKEQKPEFDLNLPSKEVKPELPYNLPSLECLEIRHKFYDNLTEDGYHLGTLFEFYDKLEDSLLRWQIFHSLSLDGYKLGSYEQFKNKLGYKQSDSEFAAKNAFERYQLAKKSSNKWINIYNTAILKKTFLSSTEISRVLLVLVITISLVLYPIRFGIIGFIWSIKTIRQK